MTADNRDDDDDERARADLGGPITDIEATAITAPYKILGDFEDPNDGIGVLGRNTAGSGTTVGVEGRVASGDGFGLYTPDDAKVDGDLLGTFVTVTASSGDAVDAETTESGGTGVYGNASAPSGGSTGVYGITSSSQYNAAGVEGRLDSSSGTGAGVYGSTYSTGTGVVGTQGRAFNSTGTSYGVEGITDSRTDGAVGVRGEAGASTGEIYGVLGTTDSGVGYGLYTPDDAKIGGNAEVSGSQSIGNLGASAYQSVNQGIGSGLGTTEIAFDTAVADDRSELNTSTGEFDCAEAGSYHVSAGAEWLDSMPGNTVTQFNIMVNGSVHTRMREDITGSSTSSYAVAHRTSRTLRGLSVGDTITIAIGQNSGSSKALDGGKANTWVTIEQVG